MKNSSILLVLFFVLLSCGSRKTIEKKDNISTKTVTKTPDLRTIHSNFSGRNSKEITQILNDAEKYLGTPYKYAGTTSSGFDCSGLVYKVFEENNKKLPRRSSDQALEGKEINISEIKPGDLLFFATSGGSKVSHVGIVHSVNPNGEIIFIHASTSKGVIISSLNEKYWNKAFLFAKSVL